MAGQAITDFFIQLGFNADAVTKGMKDVEKVIGAATSTTKKQAGATAKVTNEIREQLKLAKEQESHDSRRFRAAARLASIQEGMAYTVKQQGGMNENTFNTSEAKEYHSLLEKIQKLQNKKGNLSKKEYDDLGTSLTRLSALSKQVTRENNKLNRSFRASKFAAESLSHSLKNLARSHISVFALIGGASLATKVGQDLTALRVSLRASTGSVEEASAAFEFAKNEALRLGTGLDVATKGYSRIAIAAKSANLTMDEGKEIYLAAAEASAAFGLSAQDTEGTLRSFDQIMSKGILSTEELKKQLGNNLTGAFYLAAESMGYSTIEFNKLVKAGKLGAKEFIVPFSKHLRKVVTENGSLAASLATSKKAMQRFGTSFQINILKSFDAGAESGLVRFFDALTGIMKQAAPLFKVIGRIFGFTLEMVGVVTLALYQLFRPLTTFLDTMMNGLGKSDSIAKKLFSTLKAIAAILSVPFVGLEKIMDKYEKSSGIAAAGWAVLATGVSLFLMQILGVFKVLSKIAGMFRGLWNLGKGVKNFIRGGATHAATKGAATTGGSAFGVQQVSGASPKSGIVGKAGGLLKSPAGAASLRILGGAVGIYTIYESIRDWVDTVPDVFKIQDDSTINQLRRSGSAPLPDKYKNDSKVPQVTNYITIDSPDASHIAMELKPFIRGEASTIFQQQIDTAIG